MKRIRSWVYHVLYWRECRRRRKEGEDLRLLIQAAGAAAVAFREFGNGCEEAAARIANADR
jgi:hypothetical protein